MKNFAALAFSLTLISITTSAQATDAESIRQSAVDSKVEIQKNLESGIESLKVQVKELKIKSSNATGNLKKDMHTQIKSLEKDQHSAEKSLKKLKNSSGQAWEDMKTGAADAYERFKQSVQSAKARFGN